MGIFYWIAIVLMGSGAVMLHFKYDGNGLKRIALFFATVVIMALGQGIMTYEYVVLRGGFKIHNCIYGVFGALLFGALILWASKMVFKFEYERFRVLLGVMAIIAGWLGGNGIDLFLQGLLGLLHLLLHALRLLHQIVHIAGHSAGKTASRASRIRGRYRRYR